MTDPSERICKCCNDPLPIEQFRVQSGYRIWTCNMCLNQRNRIARDAERFRQFNALVSWPAPDVESHGTG